MKVKGGLTGYAQVNGRSFISWEEIFAYDVKYVNNITFIGDVKIVFQTIGKVFRRESIADSTVIEKKEGGKLHVNCGGVDYILHEPLHIERR